MLCEDLKVYFYLESSLMSHTVCVLMSSSLFTSWSGRAFMYVSVNHRFLPPYNMLNNHLKCTCEMGKVMKFPSRRARNNTIKKNHYN